MEINVPLSPPNYIAHIRRQLDRPFMFLGHERFVGWFLGNFFVIEYFSGEEFLRGRNPIENKAMGFVRKQNGGSVVSYHIFRGATDPISLILMFAVSFFLFAMVDAPVPVLFSLGLTVVMALFTMICTICSPAGQNGAEQLDVFLSTIE